MIRIFKSLQFPEKYGYKFNSDCYTSGSINPQFRMFETMGDGLTQHTNDWPVTIEHLSDFLFSLLTELMTVPFDDSDSFVSEVRYQFMHRPSDAEIKFAMGLIWKESDKSYSKRRYYSISLEKISSSDSKQYDKRYSRVEDWMDGEPKAVARLLLPDFAGAWRAYCHAEAIRNTWLESGKGGWGYGYPAEFLEWFDGDENSWGKGANIYMAFGAMQNFLESWRLRSCCANALENNVRRIESERAKIEAGEISA